MSNKIDPPEANHPLTGIRRTAVVQDTADAPATVNVYVGGDTTNLVPLPYLGRFPPHTGDTVVCLFVGGDGVIVGSLAGTGTAIGYSGTAASYSPSSGVDTPITNWSTVMFNNGDISYSGGVFTIGTAGLYQWGMTVALPATTAAYRTQVFAYVNGTVSLRGVASYQSPSTSAGATSLTTGFVESMAVGGTFQGGVNVSTAGVTGINPRGFTVVRVG